MRNLQVLSFISMFIFCNLVHSIELCANEKTSNIDNVVLVKALNRVSEYAIETYGDDCLVCAEVLDVNTADIEFHITSPGNENAPFNTSATVVVEITSGKVLDKALYHSCKVRVVKSGL